MAQPKLTPWFNGSVKPARPGVYERKKRRGYQRFSYWNGRHWMISARSAAGAFDLRTLCSSMSQREPWRGLAREPKP